MDDLAELPIQTVIRALGPEFVWLEVRICAAGGGWKLRHAADSDRPAAPLRPVPVDGLRELAQYTERGAFRPNKAAPTLQRGWQSVAQSSAELETALHSLYPGTVADWLEGRKPRPETTSFREFVNRQTGIYRVARELPDERAAEVVQAGCAAQFCRRQRLWPVADAGPAPVGPNPAIPCLEPCALLLELARRAGEAHVSANRSFQFSDREVAAIRHALKSAIANPPDEVREGDLGAPENPRWLSLLLARLGPEEPTASRGHAAD